MQTKAIGVDSRPIFKGAITVYSSPLMQHELDKLTERQRKHYEQAGNVSLMVSMRDGVEVNVPGMANALAAILTGFVRGIPFEGDEVTKLHAVRKTVEDILIRTVLAFEAGSIVSEGREQ